MRAKEDNMSCFKKRFILLVMVVILFMPVLAQHIFEVVKKGDLEQVKAILEKNPELVDARGENDRTPLMQAALSRQYAVFRFLVEKGADVNLRNKGGYCPLHVVAIRGERELVDLIISKGAEINSNKNVGGTTPLDFAVSRGHKDIVALLIAKGAQLNLKDKRGNTPLLRAMSEGHQDIIKLLLTKGAPVNDKDSMGSTPLLLAALDGQKDLVELLISKGANVNAKNSYGGTPVSVAAREGHQEIVDLLIAKGAKKEFIKQPVLEGEYLGQKKPGLTPELFAPGVVSTEKKELNSVFTPDGKEFYFTIQGQGKCKIMVMKQENNRWIKPGVTSFSGEGEYCDIDLFISPDGKKLYYCSNRPLEGKEESKKDFDIWVVERIKDGWSAPQNLGNLINSTEDDFYPSVTRDGTIYFNSLRPDSKGSRDIYRSKPVNGKYEKVENVGDVINSEFFEGDVLISPDEDYMIYTVDRPGGFGRGDLYLSFRDKNDNWTTPENMGNKINTEHHEYCPILSPDGKFLFFSRNNDIFWMDAGIIQKFKK
jgi:ankyrin repeat protein